MDLYAQVLEMRERAMAWFQSMRCPELGFGVHADSAFHQKNGPRGMYLPGTYNATNCLFLLGAYRDISTKQADSLAGFLNGFQRADGAYRIPEMEPNEIYYPDFEYIDLHTTNYTLGALALLGRAPRQKLAFMDRYDDPEKLSRWLQSRQMTEPWTEGNYIVNVASLFAYSLEEGEEKYRTLLKKLLDWHVANQDPASGYWYDPSTQDLTSAMAGAAHNLHLYYYLNQPVPRVEKIIDHCLGILEGISSACLDIDVVDILANLYLYGYRQADIEAYFERKLIALLAFQNPDGGFPDVRQGIRLFDGWERYHEPQGLSNTFATWFRCAAVGMICHDLYPETRGQWHFRDTLGMGYFHPREVQKSLETPVLSGDSRAPSGPIAAAIPGQANGSGAEVEKAAARIREILAVVAPERLQAAQAVYEIELAGAGGGCLSISITQDGVSVEAGKNTQARVSLGMSPDVLNRLIDGKLNATVAYMTKKLKIRGDIALAMKLEALLR
jgi:putative sterol carrier protein